MGRGGGTTTGDVVGDSGKGTLKWDRRGGRGGGGTRRKDRDINLQTFRMFVG